jgi:MFS family permease
MRETQTKQDTQNDPVSNAKHNVDKPSRGFAVFKNRDFRLLWTGAVASNIGSWMGMVAQGWLIITLTGSPGWLGAVALANSLPFLVVPLFGGVIADRVNRVALLKVTQTFSMSMTFLLAGLTFAGLIEVWMLILVSFLNAMGQSFEQPTRNALLPDLVPEDQLMQAVSLNSSAFQGAALVGPAIGGVLIEVIGVGGCMLINGFSFVFVLWALFAMRVPEAAPRKQQPVVQDMVEGLSFIRRSPVLLTCLLLTCVFSVFGRSYSTLLPAFAHLVLHTDSRALGLMYAMPGFGTLAAGFALAGWGDIRHKGSLLAATAVLGGVSIVAFALSSSLFLLLPILIVAGVSTNVFSATVSTILQLGAPGRMRGRVMSYYSITWRGLTPLGGSMVAFLAEALGTRTALAAGGLVVTLCAVGLYFVMPYIRQADEHDLVVPALTPAPETR